VGASCVRSSGTTAESAALDRLCYEQLGTRSHLSIPPQAGWTNARSAVLLKGGAVDFLTKPFDRKALLDSIARALAKNTRDLATSARIGDIRQRAKLLTPRERQVFALVVTGMLNKPNRWRARYRRKQTSKDGELS
jgi:hypothetical protein